MGSDLDEKLKVEFEKAWGRALDASMDDDFKNEDGSLNETEYLKYQKNARVLHGEAVKQAFIDAGWKRITGDPIPIEDLKPTMSFVGPGSYSDELLQHIKDDTGLMTGQEWYDRFERELFNYKPQESSVASHNGAMTVVHTTMRFKSVDIFRAAKKAAGIE
jgi:hypothetical protein